MSKENARLRNSELRIKRTLIFRMPTCNCCEPLNNRKIACIGVPELMSEVNHPEHYNKHPSGAECIDIVEHMSFNVGNAMKYLWRADHKSPNPLTDLEKAKWYIERELQKLKKQNSQSDQVVIPYENVTPKKEEECEWEKEND